MVETQKIHVEVAYALPDHQELIPLQVDQGTTVEQAIALSEIMERYPDIVLGKANKVGIFSKITKVDTVLREGDRIEIYRPLIADPKEVRRKRAEAGKVTKKGAASKNTS